MNVISRSPCEPSADLGMLVRRLVVHDEVNIEVLRHALVQPPKEAEKLLMAMASFAFREDDPCRDVQGGEQGCRAMTDVIVRDALDISQPHRQHRLRPIQGLDLALLVDAQHQRIVRWIEIQPDYVPHLLHKERIGGEFERSRPMWLNREGLE